MARLTGFSGAHAIAAAYSPSTSLAACSQGTYSGGLSERDCWRAVWGNMPPERRARCLARSWRRMRQHLAC
eukprot:1981285-Rhodomonas_salina.1